MSLDIGGGIDPSFVVSTGVIKPAFRDGVKDEPGESFLRFVIYLLLDVRFESSEVDRFL
jgi:hypothetical protein